MSGNPEPCRRQPLGPAQASRVKRSQLDWKRLAPLVLALLALAGALTAIAPQTQMDSHSGRRWLALASIVLFALYLVLRWCMGDVTGSVLGLRMADRQRPLAKSRWLLSLLLAGSTVWGVFNYYQFDSKTFAELHSVQDVTYYYLNSKYFEELGYYDLYPAMLIADEESPTQERQLRSVRGYRNLADYKMVGRHQARREAARIRGQFSERWPEFVHDSRILVSQWSGSPGYFFSDHGYNPPPTWTIVGGTLSTLVPVEHVRWLCLIDLLLIVGMFVLLWRSFGPDALLFCLLWFLCTFSGRWPMIGQSLLRFDWLVALVAAVCMFHRQRWALAGACLAYAALNRVFPAVFFFPWAVAAVTHVVRERSIAARDLRVAAGAAGVAAVLIGGALLAYGSEAFVQASENLLLHQSPESYSRYRIGFGDALGYRGELTSVDLARSGSMLAKRELVIAAKPIGYAVFAVSLVVIAIWCVRSDQRIYRGIALMAIPLFAVTNPQINYFNLRVLLVAWHLEDPQRPRNQFGILALFTIEFISQFSQVWGNDRYATTTLTSLGLTFYFAGLLISLIAEQLPALREAKLLKSKPIVLAMSAYLGLLATYGLTVEGSLKWGNKVRYASAGTMQRIHESGADERSKGVRRLRQKPLYVWWRESPDPVVGIDLSLGHANGYRLHFYRGPELLTELVVARDRQSAPGMVRTYLPLPQAARGFDGILITVESGRDLGRVGHVRAVPR